MPATNNIGSEWLEVKICLELVSLFYCVCNVKIRPRRENDNFFYRLGGGGLDEQRRSGWRSQRLSDA